jgi:release factor glutamine methyltransferase
MVDTWTVQRVLNWTICYFTSKNIPEPRLSAELLLAHALNNKRIELYLQFERILTPGELAGYRSFIQRRLQREPVQYILGETEFMGLPFKVNPAVLIPRPDTELLVDCAIEYLKEVNIPRPRILDVGAGSGCIAISLAKFFPDAEVWAVEQSTDALAVAEGNARRNEVKIQFVNNDFFDYIPGLNIKFNIVVTNPPYVSDNDWEALQAEIRHFEPRQALWGGSDGFDFYRRFIPLLEEILETNGAAMMETGYNQAQDVAEMLKDRNFYVDIRKDYRQIERVVIAKMIR